MSETVEEAYIRGQKDMQMILVMCIEIGLGKEPADKMRAISSFAYTPPDPITDKGREQR
jgi:hypothetical protein